MYKQFLYLCIYFSVGALCLTDSVRAEILIRIPENICCAEDHTVIIPLEISGSQHAEIGGYMLRLDYDEQILTNPAIITEGTLSEKNSDLMSGKAWPGDPWDFTVGTGFGFSASQDGVLVAIRFDVSAGFVSGTIPVSFVNINEDTYLNADLLRTGMELEIIPAEYISGSVILCPSPPEADTEEIMTAYLPCDFDKNGKADHPDIDNFKLKWLSACDESGWDSQYDLKEDCRINVWDLSYFADCFSEIKP